MNTDEMNIEEKLDSVYKRLIEEATINCKLNEEQNKMLKELCDVYNKLNQKIKENTDLLKYIEKFKQEIIYDLKRALNNAVVRAKQITIENSKENQIRILNTNAFLAQYYAYMKILREIDNNKFTEIRNKTCNDLRFVLSLIEKYY